MRKTFCKEYGAELGKSDVLMAENVPGWFGVGRGNFPLVFFSI